MRASPSPYRARRGGAGHARMYFVLETALFQSGGYQLSVRPERSAMIVGDGEALLTESTLLEPVLAAWTLVALKPNTPIAIATMRGALVLLPREHGLRCGCPGCRMRCSCPHRRRRQGCRWLAIRYVARCPNVHGQSLPGRGTRRTMTTRRSTPNRSPTRISTSQHFATRRGRLVRHTCTPSRASDFPIHPRISPHNRI